MQTLTTGDRRPLTQVLAAPGPFEVRLSSDLAGLDLSVFGLDSDRQLTDDRYFVFYNQPVSPEGALRRTEEGGEVVFRLDLDTLPPAVSRLVFTATHDDLPVARASRLDLRVAETRYSPLGALGAERALMVAELYRHPDGWRLAAVGQGFDGGLKALLEYFGGEAEEEAASPQVVAAPPVTASLVAAPPVAVPVSGPVSLTKNQTVNLSKLRDRPLKRVTLGLGWDPAARGKSVDLDAGCLVFDAGGRKLATVWFMALSGLRGAVLHSGDNLTGVGDGDDEQIRVDLDALPGDAAHLVFTVSSFRGQRFGAVSRAVCRVVNADGNAELARFNLTETGEGTGLVMARLSRTPDGWTFTALGAPGGGMTVNALEKLARSLL